eukprot:9469339-Pyramimonas_sp.AAC.1
MELHVLAVNERSLEIVHRRFRLQMRAVIVYNLGTMLPKSRVRNRQARRPRRRWSHESGDAFCSFGSGRWPKLPQSKSAK